MLLADDLDTDASSLVDEAYFQIVDRVGTAMAALVMLTVVVLQSIAFYEVGSAIGHLLT